MVNDMRLIEELQNIQSANGYLPMDELKRLPYPIADVIGTASFYEFFRFEPGECESYIENIYPCQKKGALLSGEKPYGYNALKKAQEEPDSIIPLLKDVGLRGRGGAGFPTASKWELTKNLDTDEKYIVCNADEGEPGTGKDRVILTLQPEAVIDGMAACAAVSGAKHGFIYLRAEYSDLKESIESAIASAPLQDFDITVCVGMGAYVCGEETALLESLEDKRGEPRLKPPYPGVAGFNAKPTILNNVESFAYAAYVIANGEKSFTDFGTDTSCGYKLYTVCGCVKNPGVYETEAGVTVRELLKMAGGISDGKSLYAIQVGGGSGKIFSDAILDMPMDIDGCRSFGAGLGTGGLWFLSDDDEVFSHVVEMTEFYAKESCGTCVPCRTGLNMLVKLLHEDTLNISMIGELARHIQSSARCALGQAAVTPVLSYIESWCKNEA
jgi:NADH-quinone oxidoreductase subunit F